MKYSELKRLKAFCEGLASMPDWREVVSELTSNCNDNFEVDGVRWISDDTIEDVLVDELSSDTYILGCFSDWLLADVTGWDVNLIKAIQESGKFESLGNSLSKNQIEDLAREYARLDGYGHHFNGYDFSEEEIKINGTDWHVFDNR